MSLSAYKPETRVVMLGAQAVEVRGLGLDAISVLVREHFPDLDSLIDLFKKGDNFDFSDMAAIALSIASRAPGLSANIIALAADEPESASNAMKIPAPSQVKLLVEIFEITFTEVGGVKKAMEMIAGLLGMTKEVKTMALKKSKTKAI